MIGVFFNCIPLQAAERFSVQFDGMLIPISIKELSDWSKGEGDNNSELASWLNLLGFESRAGLAKVLQAPLIKDKSMARQLLRSWVGRKLLDEVSDLIRLDDDRTGKRVFNTLESLLDSQSEVTTLDLLKALPAETIHLDLDEWVNLASRWRNELKSQQKLVSDLRSIPSLPRNSAVPKKQFEKFQEPSVHKISIDVSHRSEPLNLEVWEPSVWTYKRSSWILFMPGLGGDQEHFQWLSKRLSSQGWSVVVLEHPGSDSKAVQALLEGSLPAPGAEVLPERLSDLQAVLRARDLGDLKVSGKKLVLMGHSLGSLTAFLSAGASPQPNLRDRCQKALDDLSLTNLSELLQCQMVEVKMPSKKEIPNLEAIVAINSFGSLLWPSSSTAKLNIPVFLIGGTFDLITPAISEQLGLLLATQANPISRALLVEGASHFSPVRVEGQKDQKKGDDLFQLGEALVGLKPISVQSILATEIVRFLDTLERSKEIGLSVNQITNESMKFYILDRSTAANILGD